MYRYILAFLAILSIILQNAADVLPSATLNMQAEEYAIYSTILDSLEPQGEGNTLFIIDQTAESFDLEYLLEESKRQEKPYLLGSTLLDFRRK